jgi:hypothetical protein
MDELRVLYRTVQKARQVDPDCVPQHKTVCKELTLVRAIHPWRRNVNVRKATSTACLTWRWTNKSDQLLGKSLEADLSDMVVRDRSLQCQNMTLWNGRELRTSFSASRPSQ